MTASREPTFSRQRKAARQTPLRRGVYRPAGVEEQGMYAVGWLRNLGGPVVSLDERGWVRPRATSPGHRPAWQRQMERILPQRG